jgi:uncharacterized protein
MDWALVTGASKGIGRDIAIELAKRNWNLVLVARSKDLLMQLQEQISQKKIKIHIVVCDLTRQDSIDEMYRQIESWNITITALVNNAGFGSNGNFIELDREKELQQIQLNVLALVDLTHRFLPAMKERKKGYILNIASTAAFQSGPRMAVYFATKSFVLHFSEAIAFELRPHGISVTVHCPGATETEFGSQSGNDSTMLFAFGGMSSERVAKHAVLSMLKRKKIAIPGIHNWLICKLVPFFPRSVITNVASWINRPPFWKS